MGSEIPEEKSPAEILKALSTLGTTMSKLDFILAVRPTPKSELVLLVEALNLATVSVSAVVRYMERHNLEELA